MDIKNNEEYSSMRDLEKLLRAMSVETRPLRLRVNQESGWFEECAECDEIINECRCHAEESIHSRYYDADERLMK
jgi:hypothetical protein